MIEKQSCLPHSIGNRSGKGAKSVDHLKGGQLVNSPCEQKIRIRNIMQQKSSIGELINQDNLPCSGYDCTSKPNTLTFDILKKSLVMNRMNKKKCVNS